MTIEHNWKNYSWIGDKWGDFKIWRELDVIQYIVYVWSVDLEAWLNTYHSTDQLVKLWYMKVQPQEDKTELDVEFIKSEYKRWMEAYDKMLAEDDKQRELFWEEKTEKKLSFHWVSPVTIDEYEKEFKEFLELRKKPEEIEKYATLMDSVNDYKMVGKLRAELERRIKPIEEIGGVCDNRVRNELVEILTFINELEKTEEDTHNLWVLYDICNEVHKEAQESTKFTGEKETQPEEEQILDKIMVDNALKELEAQPEEDPYKTVRIYLGSDTWVVVWAECPIKSWLFGEKETQPTDPVAQIRAEVERMIEENTPIWYIYILRKLLTFIDNISSPEIPDNSSEIPNSYNPSIWYTALANEKHTFNPFITGGNQLNGTVPIEKVGEFEIRNPLSFTEHQVELLTTTLNRIVDVVNKLNK